ncbi:MAG: ribonuclease III [Erysipelotrichaceae bacterium]|nr:ribonuclease III [Erysipelotrichaceae bacterium]MBR3693915.1 ribonuclease III [Erysipelotrichales bacterium]
METIYSWLAHQGFGIKRNELMDTAFTHSSYVNENKNVHHDNERLEFMGDAVLQIYSSTKLFAFKPELSEGKMTLFRSKLVNESALANYVRVHGLAQFLRLGVGEERSGGRDRDSILADMFEAFIGAYYLIKGFDEVCRLLDHLIASYFDEQELENLEDYKTKLQEFVQADTRQTVTYEVVSMTGPSNAPMFEVIVKLEDLVLASGKGSSKKRAEQDAARSALGKLAK